MTDHNDAPEEHTPEGAAFPEGETTPPAPATMIGEESVVIDASDVDDVVEQIDAAIGEGEPLPVGANDPEVLAAQPGEEPPGMPHVPDDLDREMAEAAHQVYLRRFDDTDGPGPRIRYDSATVPDAVKGQVYTELRPHNVREALLRHIGETAARERDTLDEYAKALRVVQEARDEYVALRDQRLGAAEALFALGLDVAEDHAVIEPTAGPTITDDMIA